MFQALKRMRAARFMGRDQMSMIQRFVELEKGAGDTVYYDLLTQLSGYGVNKNDTLEGNESALTYYQDSLIVEQKRIAAAWYRMSQQRTVHELRADSSKVLANQAARILDEYLAAFLCGVTYDAAGLGADITDHGAQALVVMDANHIIDKSTVTFDPSFIDLAKWKAKNLDTPIRPLMIDGQDHYVMFLHPYQASALQSHSDWRQAQREANVRGERNPIFSGALGIWNGVVLFDWSYLPYDATPASEQAHAILCGAQAGTIAFGNPYDRLDNKRYKRESVWSWVEREDDYNNLRAVSLGTVFGCKRTIFNSEAFAVIRVDTKDVEPS
jgi:N4-gp56 family major capsid protein